MTNVKSMVKNAQQVNVEVASKVLLLVKKNSSYFAIQMISFQLAQLCSCTLLLTIMDYVSQNSLSNIRNTGLDFLLLPNINRTDGVQKIFPHLSVCLFSVKGYFF